MNIIDRIRCSLSNQESNVLKMFGVRVVASRQTHEYNSGGSTQVPTGVIYNVGKWRIRRKLGFNGKFVPIRARMNVLS